MVKECKVLSYNKFLNILVFEYDGNKIQTTATLDENAKNIFIKYENGKYEIVSKNDYDKQNNIEVNKENVFTKPVKRKDKKTENIPE